MALGIGANTALFSILDGLLLKPLPVSEPDRLITVGSDDSTDDAHLNHNVWTQIRDQRVIADAFAWTADRINIAASGEAVFLEGLWASGRFFAVLGVRPILGRGFADADDRVDGGPDGPVAVISYGLWQRRFGGTADVVGRTLTIERRPFTIVGVMPSSFFGVDVGSAFDVIVPLETEPLLGRVPSRLNFWWLSVMARLPRQATIDGETAALRAAQPAIRQATMPGYARAEDRDAYLRARWTARPARTGSSHLRTRYAPALIALVAIVGVVLLVACANIANLQLARTSARRHELSVRVALGAGRHRIVRELLVESLLLSTAGAAIGFVLAREASRILVGTLSTWASTAFLDVSADWRVLAVTAAVTVATAVLFGTVPAWRASRAEPVDALKQPRLIGDARSGVTGALVVAQVALSLLLVVGAGIFLQSFIALAYRDLGFDRSRLLIAIVDAKRAGGLPENRAALYERLREAAARVPGVESAGLSMATPLGSAGIRFTPDITASGVPLLERPRRILTTPISPDWLR
ncbi:MAG TPA: ABC transporter permease, partial [Vicinamibacterales bacterium]|nr:ABC transporter permease [Vicinamibacterales bacterium]